MSEANQFDKTSRTLARESREDLLCWLLDVPVEQVKWRGWIDRAFSLPGFPEGEGDLVAWLDRLDQGGVPWALPIEFQTVPDPDMLARLLIYCGFTRLLAKPTDLPGDRFMLLPVVINLTGKGNTAHEHRWSETRVLSFDQIAEWDIGDEVAADILDAVERGEAPRVLLAWIPLMQGGSEDGIIQQWLRIAEAEKDSKKKTDLKAVLVFADLSGSLDVWKKALEGFAVVKSVVVEEWRGEGAAAVIREALESKFGTLPEDLSMRLSEPRSVDELKKWNVSAVRADTLETFRKETGA